MQSAVFKHEVDLPIFYKERPLRKIYRADFACFGEIIVELKALSTIGGKEQAQVINYLKASNLERGLLLHFGSESLQYERLKNTHKKSVKSA